MYGSKAKLILMSMNTIHYLLHHSVPRTLKYLSHNTTANTWCDLLLLLIIIFKLFAVKCTLPEC